MMTVKSNLTTNLKENFNPFEKGLTLPQAADFFSISFFFDFSVGWIKRLPD